MMITIVKHELENPREFAELSSDLVGGVRANVAYLEGGERIQVDGLDAIEAGIALKIIKPYLAD